MNTSVMLGNQGMLAFDGGTGNSYMGPATTQYAAQAAGQAAGQFVGGFGTPWQSSAPFFQPQYADLTIPSFTQQPPTYAGAYAAGGASAYAAASGYGPTVGGYSPFGSGFPFGGGGYPIQQYPPVSYPPISYPPMPQYPQPSAIDQTYIQNLINQFMSQMFQQKPQTPPPTPTYNTSSIEAMLTSIIALLQQISAKPAPQPTLVNNNTNIEALLKILIGKMDAKPAPAPGSSINIDKLLSQLLDKIGNKPATNTGSSVNIDKLLAQLLDKLSGKPQTEPKPVPKINDKLIDMLIKLLTGDDKVTPGGTIDKPTTPVDPGGHVWGDPHFVAKVRDKDGKLVDVNFDYQGTMEANGTQVDRGYDNGVSKINLKLSAGKTNYDYDGDGKKESPVSVFSAISGKIGGKDTFSYDAATKKVTVNGKEVDLKDGEAIKFQKTGVIGADGKEVTGYITKKGADIIVNTGDRQFTVKSPGAWDGIPYINIYTEVTDAGRAAVKTADGKAYAPSGLLAMHEGLSIDDVKKLFTGKRQDILNKEISEIFKVGGLDDFEGRKLMTGQADKIDYKWGVDAHVTGGAGGAGPKA